MTHDTGYRDAAGTTMTQTDSAWRVTVRVEERVRSLGAALAATDWPDREREQGLARAHIVAEHARGWVQPYHEHPCVARLQELLEIGTPISALFAYALSLAPDYHHRRHSTGLLAQPVAELEGDELAQLLAQFKADAQLDRFWEVTRAYWTHAVADATRVLADARVSHFLALCFDERRAPVFVPNLLYPGRLPLGIAAQGEAVCICPPPQAVGESKPWHYGDDPEWTQTVAFRECCRATLWGLPWSEFVDAATIDLLATAATVIFLRESDDVPGARAFMLMEIKRYGQTSLPNAVAALDAYVKARQQYDLHVMDGLNVALRKSVSQ